MLAGPPLNERQQAELDLATLEASYSGWVGGNTSVRFRSGTSGVDRLYDVETPFESSFVAGKTARFTIVPRGVFLNSGTINPANTANNGASPYLGTYPANGVNTPTPQYASGVGGEIQMSTQNLGIAVGYTPYESSSATSPHVSATRSRAARSPFTASATPSAILSSPMPACATPA